MVPGVTLKLSDDGTSSRIPNGYAPQLTLPVSLQFPDHLWALTYNKIQTHECRTVYRPAAYLACNEYLRN